MKKLLLSIVAITTITLSSFGQAPEGFKYQAVVRDAGNLILNNQAVGMQLTIQQGSIGGPSVYTETFAVTTNAHGLINIEIGSGTTTDNFAAIDWANGPYFIETAVDVSGGTNYAVMGASQLMSVPYALYAKTAENVTNDQVNDADADPTNEIQNISLSGTNLSITNGSSIDLSSLQDGTGTDNQNIQGSGLSGTNLTIGIEGGSSETIDLSSLQDGTGTDNQNIQGSGLSGTNLTIGIQGGSNQVIDLSPLQDGTGTDDQNIQGSGLSGKVLTIGIQGGSNETVDLAPLMDELVDSDGDTKIQVEQGNDDDVIRLDVEGTEYFRFVKGRVNLNNSGYSTIYGQAAGVNDDFTSNLNSYFGAFSGYSNVSAEGNTGIGYHTLYNHTSGDNNTAVGNLALSNSETGSYNVAVGYGASASNLDGNTNTALGTSVLTSATTGSQNVGVGTNALNANIDGWNNSVVGAFALNSATTGSSNVCVGFATLFSGVTTERTVAIGTYAGYSSTGSDNVFIGYNAGRNELNSNRLYIENSNTLTPLIYGEFDNDLIRINGDFESANTAKIGSVGTGVESDPQVASTAHSGSGFLVAPWVYTNAIHAQGERGAGSTLITVGNDGTFGANNEINFITSGTERMTITTIGTGLNEPSPDSDFHIKQSSNGTTDASTGGVTFTSSSVSTNSWRIYNSGSYFSFNRAGSGRVAYVTGTGAWVQNSDSTLKKNITPLNPVLDRVMKLKPVDYHYKSQEDRESKVIGFIAQEVEPLFPEIVVHSEGKLGMTYANTGVIAIKAVQEQQEIINAQQEEIELLKAKLDQFQEQLDIIMNENK